MSADSLIWRIANSAEAFPSTWDDSASVYQGREWDQMFRAYGYRSWPLICEFREEVVASALLYSPKPYAFGGIKRLRSEINQALFPELMTINGPRILRDDITAEIHRSFAEFIDRAPFSNVLRQTILGRHLPIDHPNSAEVRKALTERGFTAGTAFTFLLNLERDHEELWSGVHPKKRNRVNRARRDGIEVREAKGLEGMRDYYAIRRQTWRRNRLPEVSFSHFETNFRVLEDSGAMRVYISSIGDVDLAGQICFLSANWVQLNGVAVADANIQGRHPGNELLQWHVIEEMSKAGLKRLDYGGATPNSDDPKKKGIHSFKASWGGDLVEHFQFERVMPGWRASLFRLMAKSKGTISEEEQNVL